MRAAVFLPVALLIGESLAQSFTLRSWSDSFTLANNIVANLTLSEKVGIITGKGQFGSRCIGDTHEITRLGIPALCMNDGPAGIRASKNVTGFPAGINAASTFSRRLIRARGKAMGEEFRGKGIHVFLGPAMDIMRNPKAGRGWESFGPDPFLTAESAYETIIGVQSVGVMATAKHLIANNQEHWRYGLSANVDDRTLHEIYWYPFLRAIEADVASVMCAYNRVNGTSSCDNPALIGPNGLLRKEAGFQGFVISDWGATHDDAAQTANNGLEMEQPGDWILIGGGVYGSHLSDAVNNKGVSQDRINQMASRILASWYHLGQDQGYPPVNFDAQHPDGSGSLNLNVNVRTNDHTAIAREIATASSVLLKNSPSGSKLGLPLKAPKTIAVIGQDAKDPKKGCNLNECNEGTMAIGWGSGSNSFDFLISPATAIQSFVGSTAVVTSSLSLNTGDGINAARGKDVALVFVNAMSGELGFYDTVVNNMGDRNELDLWWNGADLVNQVASVNNNTIVIVHSVGPVYMPFSTHPNVSAIIYAGAPGEQTGPAIVDVLWGKVNPSGRLPFSIADNEAAYPGPIVYNSLGFPDINYDEKLLLDYRFMQANNITPRFEYGFGLSYTTFAYSGLTITSAGNVAPNTGITGSSTGNAFSSLGVPAYTVTFTIKNSGSVAGTEIPQLYLRYPQAAGEPPLVLRGFDDIALAVGESKTVQMVLNKRDICIWDTPSQSWVRPTGEFGLSIGASIKDVRLQGTF